MNKLNKLVTVMAVATMTLGVNAGDMKKIGLANPNTPTPSLVKTDTKEELQKEIMTELKGWKPVYQVNVLQKISGTGCVFIELIESCLNSVISTTVKTEEHY
jgi:hypothetical protein